MTQSELLTVIALTVALAAYVSTVRQRVLDKHRYGYAIMLLIADIPLIVAGLILAVTFGDRHFTGRPHEGAIHTGLVFLGIALLALAVLHIYEWCKSLKKAIEIVHGKTPEAAATPESRGARSR